MISRSRVPSSRPGGEDSFVLKLSADGSILEYASYLGGRFDDLGLGIALDDEGNAYLTGETKSTDFPLVRPIFREPHGGSLDGSVTKISDLDLPPVIQVGVDVIPGVCRNSLRHIRNLQLRVASLGSAGIDVAWIDPFSIRLQGTVSPITSLHRTERLVKDVSSPVHEDMLGGRCVCWDGYEDGETELLVRFRLDEVLEALDTPPVPGDPIPWLLTGKLLDEYGGSEIEGQDCLLFMP